MAQPGRLQRQDRGDRARLCSSKGTQLFIQGKIQTRSWDDKESGQKRYWTEIFVQDLTLLGGRPRTSQWLDSGYSRSNGRKAIPGRVYWWIGRPAIRRMEELYTDEGNSNPDEIPF